MKATISREPYGTVDGTPVSLWTLTNSHGMRMRVTNYGTIITELWVPDAKGQLVDVVLGRNSVQEYIDRTQYFGATVGRCANRIAKGQFTIDGKAYQVTCNNGPNMLHGGARGFDKVIWSESDAITSGEPSITFCYTSPEGQEGFPGACAAQVTYTLTEANELRVVMDATVSAPTVVNLAHHSYWNLGGHGSGAILDHTLLIEADAFTPADATFMPTGEIQSVAGTPLDFRAAKPIGQDITQLPATKDDPGGYDHNFVVRGAAAGSGAAGATAPGAMRRCAVLRSPATGIVMTISSNQPGIQFYSGNFLDGVPGKHGAVYDKFDALCLETQAYPDSINKQGLPGWPTVIVRPGAPYHHEMVHAFTSVE